MSTNRTCHYCGQNRCGCKYRAGRRGLSFTTLSNITSQTTLGQVRKSFEEIFKQPDDTPCLFQISITYIDPAKGGKA